jgi:hypothetical protein
MSVLGNIVETAIESTAEMIGQTHGRMSASALGWSFAVLIVLTVVWTACVTDDRWIMAFFGGVLSLIVGLLWYSKLRQERA